MRKISKVLITTLAMSLVGLSVFAQATTTVPTELQQVITRIKRTLQGLAFLIAVVFIILGGYQFLTAAGSAEKIEAGKKNIMWALIGLVVILLAEILARTACWLATESWSC
jgi:type IV secretory pathway VirB2 component (pilin)